MPPLTVTVESALMLMEMDLLSNERVSTSCVTVTGILPVKLFLSETAIIAEPLVIPSIIMALFEVLTDATAALLDATENGAVPPLTVIVSASSTDMLTFSEENLRMSLRFPPLSLLSHEINAEDDVMQHIASIRVWQQIVIKIV